jgi:hypothetical protein
MAEIESMRNNQYFRAVLKQDVQALWTVAKARIWRKLAADNVFCVADSTLP